MSQQGQVRFARIRGRIVPIRGGRFEDKSTGNRSKGASAGHKARKERNKKVQAGATGIFAAAMGASTAGDVLALKRAREAGGHMALANMTKGTENLRQRYLADNALARAKKLGRFSRGALGVGLVAGAVALWARSRNKKGSSV